MTKPFVPVDFDVPQGLVTDRIRLRMLGIDDAVRDFEAVMSSVDHLRTAYKPEIDWPEGLTLHTNIAELGWHETEFLERQSFAYTVVNLADTRTLGCVYFDPTNNDAFDAEVRFWVRQDQLAAGLDDHLSATVRDWVQSDWPFSNPVYPDRT